MIYNFVLVNYNNSKISLDCVNSIMKNNFKGNVLIIDNNSNDSEKLLLKDNVTFEVMFLKNNIGYGAALNRGIEFFVKRNGFDQVLIVGNNDLIYSNNFCECLENTSYPKDIMIISPDIIKTKNNVHQNPFSVNEYTKIERFKYKMLYLNYNITHLLFTILNKKHCLKSEKNKNNFDKSCYIKMGHGACLILLPAFLKRCGKLNVPLFMYGEELFISLQVENKHGKIYYDNNVKVYHNEHMTIGYTMTREKFNYLKNAYKLYDSKKRYN